MSTPLVWSSMTRVQIPNNKAVAARILSREAVLSTRKLQTVNVASGSDRRGDIVGSTDSERGAMLSTKRTPLQSGISSSRRTRSDSSVNAECFKRSRQEDWRRSVGVDVH